MRLYRGLFVYLFSIVALILVTTAPSYAQVGMFYRTDWCSDILIPVVGSTYCTNTTVQQIGVWTGSAYTPISGSGNNTGGAIPGIPNYTGTPTTGHCAEWASSTSLEDAGAACGSGGGGSSYAFNHSLTSSPTCNSTTGTNPSLDIYTGALGGNATYTLPSSTSCINNDVISINPTQGSGSYTVSFSAGAGTSIAIWAPGGSCYSMPTSSGNTAIWNFKYDSINSIWDEFCPGTNPAQAIPVSGSLIAEKSACTLSSSTWTCSPSGYSIGTLTLTGNQTIDMGSGGTAGQLFTIRVTQDSTGGRIPTWGSMFLFESSNNQGSSNTLVPMAFANGNEDITFQYDDTLSKWVYLFRSSMQQIAPTFQGGGTTIGTHPGNGGQSAATLLPPNTETQVFSDDGGFDTGGVYYYTQLQVGVIQFCNYGTVTTLATFHCNLGNENSPTVHTAPAEIPPGQCTEFHLNEPANQSEAPTTFTGYECMINPGNTTGGYATWNSVYNEEVPQY